MLVTLFLIVGCTNSSKVSSNLNSSNTGTSTGTPTNTPLPTPTPITGPDHTIKWNPGHYMASLGIENGGNSATTWTEGADALSALTSSSGVVGYRAFVYWGTVEGPSQGQYNFVLLDNLLSKLAAMSPQRHLVLVIMPGAFSPTDLSQRSNIIPSYILHDSQFGPSPDAGSYGWCGGPVNSTGATACIHRPAVAQAFGNMLAAVAARYDKNPLFEGLMVQEDSWMYGGAERQPGGASDFSNAAFVAGFETALSLAVAAAPHTNIAMQNTWAGDTTQTQEFETWMYNHRILPADTDTHAASIIQNKGLLGLSWGLAAYVGVTVPGSSWNGPDMRPTTRAWCDIEGTELGYPKSPLTGQSVLDVLNGVNTVYKCSHAFWTWMPNGFSSGPSWSWWPNLAPVIQSNPVTSVDYPQVYP